MLPKLLVIMLIFQQQGAVDMQKHALEMLQPKDDLAAQEAMFQQQRADYLQHEKDA
jgi:hypothetical protein